LPLSFSKGLSLELVGNHHRKITKSFNVMISILVSSLIRFEDDKMLESKPVTGSNLNKNKEK
jgi:hypothetical protein